MTTAATWTAICTLSELVDGAGIAVVHQGCQVAVFLVEGRLYALSNVDPFSGAGVLSRGIVGDRDGVLKVASPLYKQSFALADGRCLDDPAVRIPVWQVRLGAGGLVELGAEAGQGPWS